MSDVPRSHQIMYTSPRNRSGALDYPGELDVLTENVRVMHQRIVELEAKLVSQASQFDSELDVAWTTGTHVPEEDDSIVEFELVLLPFMSQFRYLWTMDTQHNVDNGTQDRWTQINDGVKWYDPLVPTGDAIKALKKLGLIQRVEIKLWELSANKGPVEKFIESLQHALKRATNVKKGETLTTAYERIGREIDMEADIEAVPAWANGLNMPIMPLKPAFGNDQVLEYLPVSPVSSPPTWSLDFFLQPDMSQLVRDPKTGANVRRVYLTTIEGYLGLMPHGLGLDKMGMS